MSTPARPIPRIFVSHSHHDNTFCRPFVAHLRSALGATDPDAIFYDETALHLGDEWLAIIQREVEARPIFLIILTPRSVEANYVRAETNLALRLTIEQPRERRLISVLAEECDPNALAPLLLGYQMADFAHQRYDDAFAALVAALRGTPANLPSAAVAAAPAASPQAAQAARARQLAEETHIALAAGRYGDAIVRAELALSLPGNETDAALRADLALALAGAGRWNEALTAANQALELDPFRMDLLRVVARAEQRQGNTRKAIEALDRARALVPLDDDAGRLDLLAERRALLIEQQQWAAALETVDEELTLAPDDSARLNVRADLLRRLGRDAEAVAVYQRLGRDGEALDLLVALNRRAEALAVARKLTARPDATAAQWLARARLARAVTNDDAEVRAAVDAAARLAGERDPAVAEARTTLLPPPIAPERFPARLADLGFTARTVDTVEVIVPPVVPVPAGEFLMGSDKRQDGQAYNSELPQHKVTLPSYQIAKFPVTVAEYACFVRAGGKEPQRYEYSGSVVDWQTQLQHLDYPVVCVTWRDAMAYAAWLAQLTGQPWRLPTEAEWEKAARGTDGRIYPWGNAWDKTRANTWDGGPHTTTPVGQYLGGASPYGALDMAGNVWEWTSSLYKAYPYSGSDGRENAESTGNRVLRGGQWGDYPLLARAAGRVDGDPDNFDHSGGFRVLLAAAPGSF